jgi:hypothetical protein
LVILNSWSVSPIRHERIQQSTTEHDQSEHSNSAELLKFSFPMVLRDFFYSLSLARDYRRISSSSKISDYLFIAFSNELERFPGLPQKIRWLSSVLVQCNTCILRANLLRLQRRTLYTLLKRVVNAQQFDHDQMADQRKRLLHTRASYRLLITRKS